MRRAAAAVLSELAAGARGCVRTAPNPAIVQSRGCHRGAPRTSCHSGLVQRLSGPGLERPPLLPALSSAARRHPPAGLSSAGSCWRRQPAPALVPGAAGIHGSTAVASTSGSAQPTAGASTGGKGREFPDNVRVGVGVVILRPGPSSRDGEPELEVLMARRAKAPDLGKWSFPGGGQRLGETLIDCAKREAAEETGLTLGGILEPRVLTAVDCIMKDPTGRIQFHYCIVEVVSSVAADVVQHEAAASDVSELTWLTPGQIADLEGKGQVSVGCADVAFEARRQYCDVVNAAGDSKSVAHSE